MRPRNREINIFNLSMLDVLAGAMAAFLIIMIVLLPYYRKEHIDYQAMLDALREQLVAARQQAEAAAAQTAAADAALAAAEARATAAETAAARAEQAAAAERARAEGLAQRLAKTFLVLYVRWDTGDDIDLHVTDPSGAEFSYQQKRIAGRPGELSEDTLTGPGNEVWEIREAPPGAYRVEVVLFSVKDARKPVRIQGRVFHRDGSAPFPEVRLGQPGERRTVTTIEVAADGGARLR